MSVVPFDDRDGWIWLDGRFVPWREAKLHVLSHGLHYASAVFEGARMYGGEVYELTAHTKRLFKSAEMLDFEIPFTVAEIDQACKDACARNGLGDAYLRPIAWRGSEMIGVAAQDTRTHVAIAVWDWPSYFSPEVFERGVRMTWAKYRRPSPETEPVHAKATGLYMICTISKHAAEKQGFHDAMMLDYRGYLAESTGSNVFLIRDGAIHTPTPDCFLNGLTRQSVIRLARARGIEVVERHILPDELATFSECFVTGTAAEITPVGQIAEYNFKPGALTFSLAEEYARLVRRQTVAA